MTQSTPHTVTADNVIRICPIDHTQFKTRRVGPEGDAAVWRDDAGVWHVRDFDAAKQLLRGRATRQAGFKAEFQERMPDEMRRPILYQEGPKHLEQRKQTARFFTPRAVETYRPMMESLARELVVQLKRDKRADVRALNLTMAMRVVSQVVGLTDSRLPGIAKRLDVFLANESVAREMRLMGLFRKARNRISVLTFFFLDVKPSIEKRRKQRADDLISYLLDQGYTDWEIFTECVTYGAAGMVTTREFMALALWHLVEQPALAARYQVAGEEERIAILQEILRLEPIVAQLKRRSEQDITLTTALGDVTIPAGSQIVINVQAANADVALVGENPHAICPMREMHAPVVMPSVIAFGDGHHRCPGSYVALQETDVLLMHLLPLPGLRIVHLPEIGWSETASGPELHNFVIEVD